MARKSSTTDSPSPHVTANAKEIGYVLGKMEMLEKKFDEHREESKIEKELIISKLEQMSKNMSFWRHGLWIIKAVILSLPLILAGNTQGLMDLWKSF